MSTCRVIPPGFRSIEDLSEHFSPPGVIELELSAIANETWPYEVESPRGYNIASTFEAVVAPEPRLVLLDVIDHPMHETTARDSLRRRIESCPWPPLPSYSPRRGARLRHLWLVAVVALERRERAVERVIRDELTDLRVSYSYTSKAGSSSLKINLEAGDPAQPYLRLESEWNERDGREEGPTIRYPAEWEYQDQVVLKTDADVAIETLDQMGAALMDWWLKKLPTQARVHGSARTDA